MNVKWLFAIAATGLLSSGCNDENTSRAPSSPETEAQKQAYSVGAMIGAKIKDVSGEVVAVRDDFDIDMYLLGIQDTVKDSRQLSDEELKTIYDAYQKQLVELRREKDKADRAASLKASEEFLEENRNKEGVVTTDSGLQYTVLNKGTGASPGIKDTVVVLYTGRLVNGNVFDTTSATNEPRQFKVSRVVRGWTEGLQLMNEGSKYQFYLPPALGYGSQNRSKIPPNSVLIFDVELVRVIKAEAPAPKG